jgi:hypothetical protein
MTKHNGNFDWETFFGLLIKLNRSSLKKFSALTLKFKNDLFKESFRKKDFFG